MIVPRPRESSEEINRDCRYHRSGLKADPKTAGMVAGVDQASKRLKGAAASRVEAEDVRAEAQAIFERSDLDLDDEIRMVELEVLKGVKKDRTAPVYKAIFPKKLKGITSLRGQAEVDAVERMRHNLNQGLPAIDQAHGAELDRLCQATLSAEKVWKASNTLVANAVSDELAARVAVIEQLQKDEGALKQIYPGQKERVNSFFRPRRTDKAAKKAEAQEDPAKDAKDKNADAEAKADAKKKDDTKHLPPTK